MEKNLPSCNLTHLYICDLKCIYLDIRRFRAHQLQKTQNRKTDTTLNPHHGNDQEILSCDPSLPHCDSRKLPKERQSLICYIKFKLSDNVSYELPLCGAILANFIY